MKYLSSIMLFISLMICSCGIPAEAEDSIGAPKIWDSAGHKFISQDALLEKISHKNTLLLGLRPDNENHHQAAQNLIRKLVNAGRKPVILLSTVERDKQNAFTIFAQNIAHRNAKNPKAPLMTDDATGLDILLDWAHSGQPSFPTVKPLFDMAVEKKLSLRAVNFSRYEIGALYSNGLSGLPKDVAPSLRPLLDKPLSRSANAKLMAALQGASCVVLPPAVLDKLSIIRRARDSLFALTITQNMGQSVQSDMTILITSKDHISKDMGVPLYLEALTSPKQNTAKNTEQTISLTFVEVSEEDTKIAPLAPDVDYIWYTHSMPRPVDCP